MNNIFLRKRYTFSRLRMTMTLTKTLKNDIFKNIILPPDSSLPPALVTSGTIFVLSLIKKIFR